MLYLQSASPTEPNLEPTHLLFSHREVPGKEEGSDRPASPEGFSEGDGSKNHPLSGTIELRSGIWQWIAHGEPRELVVLFHDERRPNNRMRSRLTGAEPSEETILQAAREPERRWWEDPVGGMWEIRVEEAPSILPEKRIRPRHRIIFTREDNGNETELPEGRTLGELSTVELAALLYDSTTRERA